MLKLGSVEQTINSIKDEYLKQISEAADLKTLDEIYLKLFGKTGEITELPKQFKGLAKEELRKVGSLFNQVKTGLEKAIEEKRNQVREENYKAFENEKFDSNENTTLKERKGHLHPITQFNNKIKEVFSKIGFQLYDAPHIDTDFNNFEVLNIPQQHPARDLWDTLYVDSKAPEENQKLLLRTHTSNAQVRIMKEFKVPFRMMVLDRCFRYENLDARHEHTFDQFEIVYVDKGVTMTNLQYLSEYLLKNIFGDDIKARLRPKYYPFVEPGVGVDSLCIFCKGKGCKICSGVGWLEVAGAGMIHPTVLKNGGLDPNEYSGIAWGFGPFRMAMLKYGIGDIRAFNGGDLKFLEKF